MANVGSFARFTTPFRLKQVNMAMTTASFTLLLALAVCDRTNASEVRLVDQSRLGTAQHEFCLSVLNDLLFKQHHVVQGRRYSLNNCKGILLTVGCDAVCVSANLLGWQHVVVLLDNTGILI